jgi:hypothetical protein
MASSSYSAIKIPVPGNLIDTPGAVDGHLLYYDNETNVYKNFKPLIVDLRPNTNNRKLEFNVSVSSSNDSYDLITETGMILEKEITDGDFKLTVNGEIQVGRTTGSVDSYTLPSGTVWPEDINNRKFLNLDTDGTVLFETLDSITQTTDNSIIVNGNDISVDVNTLWATLYQPGDYITIVDATTGGIIDVNIDTLQADGALFTAGDGIDINSGIIKIDKDWTDIDGNLFTAGDGIDINSGTISSDIANAGVGLSVDAPTRTINSLWDVGVDEPSGDGVTADVGILSTDSWSVSAIKLEGHSRWDFMEGSGSGNRGFVLVLRNINTGDGGGLKIQAGDENNDEFSILCESLTGAEGGWIENSGHNITETPLTANIPTFYVKSASGMMYNASNYYTEGKIVIGSEYYTGGDPTGVDYPGGNNMRLGSGTLMNPPAHISIIDKYPTILLDQATTDSTAPTIIMTSANSSNIDAFGTSGGEENAYTLFSNRDGNILHIETSTTDSHYYRDYSGASQLTLNNYRTAWALDFYDEGDGEQKICMRMGSLADGSIEHGTYGLPTSAGSAPSDMPIGGFWIDTTNNDNIVKVKMQ